MHNLKRYFFLQRFANTSTFIMQLSHYRFIIFTLDNRGGEIVAYANTFMRHEIKYLLTKETEAALLPKISRFMCEDEYSGQTISSLYCDSDDFSLIRTSLDKPIYKEKLRLRAYGVPSDKSTVFLEIKKKFKGISYKRRAELTCAEAMNMLNSGVIPQKEHYNEQQVLSEIEWIIGRYALKPRVAIFYDRVAFFSEKDNELRLTLDSNIRYRLNKLDPRLGTFGEPVLNQPHSIMEIKTAGGLPKELVDILSELKIYSGSFSKYGAVYLGTHEHDFIME